VVEGGLMAQSEATGEGFEAWLAREYRYAAGAMLRSVSAVEIVKTRPGFGHSIRAAQGSIIASPVLASYDPDPDYFFHWFRDSAVVIDAIRLLHEDGALGDDALRNFRDFVRFSLSLRALDGRELVKAPQWREGVIDSFEQYLRDDAELSAIQGDRVFGDTRVNPNGTLDISKWARPQHDGPPLRALAVLRWIRSVPMPAALSAEASELLRADLAFTHAHWRDPSFDIWEEERGEHYYTLCVAEAALREGAEWLHAAGNHEQTRAYRADAAEIRAKLDGFWRESAGHYSSRVLTSGAKSTKELDIALILAAVHVAGGSSTESTRHSARDPRMHATLARLEALFDVSYPINHQRPAGRGPAMGRYAGDVYYSGGAYFFSTLGAAEFCFLAAGAGPGAAAARNADPRNADAGARRWFERGDAYLETVRAYTGPDGALSEQFDQRTGEQTSARHLAWSYAAFISTLAARRAAKAQLQARPQGRPEE
jgi:glucoamylase